jgi:hypothetical protein
MILTVLSVATVLTVATPPTISPPGGIVAPTPNLYPQPAPDCRDVARRVAYRQRIYFEKLGRLPPANLEYAVLRQIDGCTVPAPVGYHPPAAPGAADSPPLPVTHEGAPSNRR